MNFDTMRSPKEVKSRKTNCQQLDDWRAEAGKRVQKASNKPRRESRSFHSPPRSCQLLADMTPVSPLSLVTTAERRSSSKKNPKNSRPKSIPRSLKVAGSVKESPRSIRESPRSVRPSPRSDKKEKSMMSPASMRKYARTPLSVKDTTTTSKKQQQKKSESVQATPSFESANTSSNASSANASTISSGKSLLDGVNRDRRRNIIRNRSLARKDRLSSTTLEATTKKKPATEDKMSSIAKIAAVVATQDKFTAEKPPQEESASLEATKEKSLNLYEMHLAKSTSSGMEVNAGSFASISPPDRRKKSEFELKIEERQKRLSRNGAVPPSLELPDITGPGADENDCTSPVARIRRERNISPFVEASQAVAHQQNENQDHALRSRARGRP